MRLALFSPFPPLASGIADYSYELLPQLARHAEVDLFIDDGYQPVKAITECYPTYGYRQFEALRHSRRYDFILYHVGNVGVTGVPPYVYCDPEEFFLPKAEGGTR